MGFYQVIRDKMCSEADPNVAQDCEHVQAHTGRLANLLSGFYREPSPGQLERFDSYLSYLNGYFRGRKDAEYWVMGLYGIFQDKLMNEAKALLDQKMPDDQVAQQLSGRFPMLPG